jgi:hypothetical protein
MIVKQTARTRSKNMRNMSNLVASSMEKSVNEEGRDRELHVIFGTGPSA